MDSQFTEGELMQPFNDFHHGAYSNVLSFSTTSLSPEAKQPARILQLRSKIALGQAKAVLSETKGKSTPEISAVRALAEYTGGNKTNGLAQAEKLAESESENATVQVLAGTVLAAEGKVEEALLLLGKHQGSLEAVALTVQIHLGMNRTDLAAKEVQSAKKWAQDSLLVNIAESWVGIRKGGERYQQAFYEFEEMPVCQSVAEIHLGRLPEAEAALQKQLEENPDDIEALANTIVLNTLSGRDTQELMSSLKSKQAQHPMLVDLHEKSGLFDTATSKYSAKASA